MFLNRLVLARNNVNSLESLFIYLPNGRKGCRKGILNTNLNT